MSNLETYTAWANVPDHLKTKTQLGKLGLRPTRNQKPAACFVSYIRGRSRPRTYDLYDVNEAIPKRKPSKAQLAALDKARAAAEVALTCKGCGVKPGHRHLRGGFCSECRVRRSAKRTAERWIADDPLFLDTETTGLNSDDEVVEIALLDMEGNMLIDTLICPTRPIPVDATRIHGIQNKDVVSSPTFADIMPDLHRLIENRRVVIYNAEFDVRLLAQSAGAHGITESPVVNWVCAMELYARYYGQWSNYYESYKWQALSDAASQCGIEQPAALHRAAGDAELTRRIMLFMAESS